MAATIADVAKEAGVGIGTVSRVINGGKSVTETTMRAVEAAITKLAYNPNSAAKRLRRQRSGVIALMVPVLYQPFFARFAQAVEQTADEYGYSVLLVASQEHVQKENRIIERIKSKEVDGAIFVTHYEHNSKDYAGCPLVSIDRRLGDDIPCVTSNNYQATTTGIEYLIQKGCSRIGYIGTKPLVASEVLLREKAYRDVMQKHGMGEYVVNEVAKHGEEGELVKKFFDMYGDVDGLFAAGYSVARAVGEHAASIGRDIPNDLQLLSYDGGFSDWNGAALLSCIEQPIDDMAKAAVELLINKIDGKQTERMAMLQGKLVIGRSTKI